MDPTLPAPDYVTEKQFWWPWNKFCLPPDALYTTLHERFNTRSSTIQEPSAFHRDVVECANNSSTVEELYNKLAGRKSERINEIDAAWTDASIIHCASRLDAHAQRGILFGILVKRISTKELRCLSASDVCLAIGSRRTSGQAKGCRDSELGSGNESLRHGAKRQWPLPGLAGTGYRVEEARALRGGCPTSEGESLERVFGRQTPSSGSPA
ncbi:hypothetical protein VdG2_02691 [Verticillium dahliae VDG2]|nr:hypothetical protein VdG2_02691 [Verticillium dahliae VDG2]